MAKKNKTEIEKHQKLMEASNQMMANSIKDYIKRKGDAADETVIHQMRDASQLIVDVTKERLGVEMDNAYDLADADKMMDVSSVSVDSNAETNIFDKINSVKKNEELKGLAEWAVKEDAPIMKESENASFNLECTGTAYDVIPLPSNGECYGGAAQRVQVAYLTANEENILISPNLYKNGLVTDMLLKSRVMSCDVDVEKLVKGDVDAIMLWLRATAYGTDFPITVTDPISKERFDSVVDLSTLKYKDFTLKGDKDGCFMFECPLSKNMIKFRFLTRKDERELELLTKVESNGGKATTLRQEMNVIKTILEHDDVLKSSEKGNIGLLLNQLDGWAQKLVDSGVGDTYNKYITNRMEMQIVSINGNTNRNYIHQSVLQMRTSDSLAFRRYVAKNEPGVDWEIEVQRPSNLGGGSFKTFLEWDDDVFINLA